tara:strand:+ start:495 stop:791 length:297 start_codon:yes stop_codon:yes gene_type:complete
MIKVGDLVAVDGNFGNFLGIVNDRLEGDIWEWTVIECSTGDYVPCSTQEITVITSPKQADAWERQIKMKKILDKSNKRDTLLTQQTTKRGEKCKDKKS